jgi:ABC-type transporter MlaC component
VTTYRDAFADEARANGVDGLIRMLSDKNSSPGTGKTA